MTAGEETPHPVSRNVEGRDEDKKRNQPMEREAKKESEVWHHQGQRDDRQRQKPRSYEKRRQCPPAQASPFLQAPTVD